MMFDTSCRVQYRLKYESPATSREHPAGLWQVPNSGRKATSSNIPHGHAAHAHVGLNTIFLIMHGLVLKCCWHGSQNSLLIPPFSVFGAAWVLRHGLGSAFADNGLAWA